MAPRKYAPKTQTGMPPDYDYLYPKLCLDDSHRLTKIDEILKPFIFDQKLVDQVRDVFLSEMELGLAKEPKAKSSLQMENTFLPELPNGKENGEFLALDLGGTNFRVILVKLEKDNPVPDYNIQYYSVPEQTRLGAGEELFDFLAECIGDFLRKNNLREKPLPLGFCFSFPMIQGAINKGILVSWTKSFNCPGVVGKDAVEMLANGMKRKGISNVTIVAVVNDTTGTLAKGAFVDRECFIGLILGTGTNACYVEKVENIPKFEGEDREGINEVVIDIEFGAFGDNGVLNFIKTQYDVEVDKNSLLLGNFTYEKMFAGKFLGELVRNILVKMCEEGLLFSGVSTELLQKPQSLTTSDVSEFEKVDNDKIQREIVARFGYPTVSSDDIEIVRHVCEVCSTRGALLVSICLSSLLLRMKRPNCTIAIDGSLFKHHPEFSNMMTEFIRLMAPGYGFKLMLAEDGSGKGAGITAAVAARCIQEGKIRLH